MKPPAPHTIAVFIKVLLSKQKLGKQKAEIEWIKGKCEHRTFNIQLPNKSKADRLKAETLKSQNAKKLKCCFHLSPNCSSQSIFESSLLLQNDRSPSRLNSMASAASWSWSGSVPKVNGSEKANGSVLTIDNRRLNSARKQSNQNRKQKAEIPLKIQMP